jgi:hypothetical protein
MAGQFDYDVVVIGSSFGATCSDRTTRLSVSPRMIRRRPCTTQPAGIALENSSINPPTQIPVVGVHEFA